MFNQIIHFLFYLQLFLITGNCSEYFEEFCANNYVDSVLWYGYRHRVTQNDLIADYNYETGKLENFQKIGQEISASTIRYQSAFPSNCVIKGNECQNEKNVTVFKVTFLGFDTSSGEQYLKVITGNKSSIDTMTLKWFTGRNKINSSTTHVINEYDEKPHQRYKTATYWSLNNTHGAYIAIFNSNSTNAFFVRWFSGISQVYDKRKNSITNSNNLLFTSVFWWTNCNDCIYAVIELKNQTKRNGFMFKLNKIEVENLDSFTEQSFPFTNSSIRVNEFFGCSATVDNENTNKKNSTFTTVIHNNDNVDKGVTESNDKFDSKRETDSENKQSKNKMIVIIIIVVLIIIIVIIVIFASIFLYLHNKSKSKKKAVPQSTTPQSKPSSYKSDMKFTPERLRKWRKHQKFMSKVDENPEEREEKESITSTGFQRTDTIIDLTKPVYVKSK